MLLCEQILAVSGHRGATNMWLLEQGMLHVNNNIVQENTTYLTRDKVDVSISLAGIRICPPHPDTAENMQQKELPMDKRTTAAVGKQGLMMSCRLDQWKLWKLLENTTLPSLLLDHNPGCWACLLKNLNYNNNYGIIFPSRPSISLGGKPACIDIHMLLLFLFL